MNDTLESVAVELDEASLQLLDFEVDEEFEWMPAEAAINFNHNEILVCN
ncbi:hypothetical protein [Streptomyces sp. NPDC060027]